MKTYCRRLDIGREHVAYAYERWRQNESGRRNHWRVSREYGGEDALIDEILSEVRSRTLSFEPIRRERRTDPSSGKLRVIGIAGVKQQVCDYLAVTLMEGLLRARTGFYQCANERGKGLRLCRGAIRRWSRFGGYHVKLDVRKCYPSVRTDLVASILRRYVASEDVLYVCDALLATYDGGLEIGSYFSLRMCQLVLSFAYHYVESLGKRRRGRWVPLVRHQVWHLDDILLVGPDKRDLKVATRELGRYMRDELGLELKPWKVARTSEAEPLDMGGYRASGGRVVLRRGLFLRCSRAFTRFERRPTITLARRVVSYWGWLSHGDCSELVRRRRLGRAFSRARHMVSRHERRVTHGTYAVGDAA